MLLLTSDLCYVAIHNVLYDALFGLVESLRQQLLIGVALTFCLKFSRIS